MTLPYIYISKPISLIEYYEQMRITDNCHQKTFNEVEKINKDSPNRSTPFCSAGLCKNTIATRLRNRRTSTALDKA